MKIWKTFLGWVYYIYENLFFKIKNKKVLKVNKKYPQLLVNNLWLGNFQDKIFNEIYSIKLG